MCGRRGGEGGGTGGKAERRGRGRGRPPADEDVEVPVVEWMRACARRAYFWSCSSGGARKGAGKGWSPSSVRSCAGASPAWTAVPPCLGPWPEVRPASLLPPSIGER